MRETCDGCGVVKDMDALEVHRYPEDGLTDEPIEPIGPLDVAPTEKGAGYRRADVCLECFHRLSPDMWISQRGWEGIGPAVPFDNLPMIETVPVLNPESP